jgi:hypothetical protein
MYQNPDSSASDPTGKPLSRRSLLNGAAALSVSALATAGLASIPARTLAAPKARTRPRSTSTQNLVFDYRPSQPTGWSPTLQPALGSAETVGTTIGGHTSSLNFSFNSKNYKISVLSLGQPRDSPDPVYESMPTDATVNFSQTLADRFGAHYSFDYLGGFKGKGEFSVQSYSVFVQEPTAADPALLYGLDMYFVYNPDLRAGDPGIHDSLQFIQVVNWLPPNGSQQPISYVDDSGRANPFYSIGGLTSINGGQAFNFVDAPHSGEMGRGPGGNGTLSTYPFTAEVFLVQDTGVKDAAGKDIIKVFGGIKYGWQVQSV